MQPEPVAPSGRRGPDRVHQGGWYRFALGAQRHEDMPLSSGAALVLADAILHPPRKVSATGRPHLPPGVASHDRQVSPRPRPAIDRRRALGVPAPEHARASLPALLWNGEPGAVAR